MERSKSGVYIRFIKRIVDFILALVAILLLCPVLLIVALLVRTKLGSPVLFKQERPGVNGKVFTLYKFRTMTNERNKNGELLENEKRLTKFGSMLRKFSLDELPQLFNVVKGDISLVGPRPLLVEYLPLYSSEQVRRHEVRPGITGWAQINGRNGISWEEKFKLDIWYVDNQSLLLDIKIILLTIKKVMKSEGVSGEKKYFVGKFEGSKKG